MEEDNNNIEQGFDEMGQEEIQGEGLPYEEQINIGNEYQQDDQGEGHGEIMFQNEPINDQEDFNINNQIDQNNQNDFNNINQDQLYQQQNENVFQNEEEIQMQYPKENEQFQENENDEYFQENENNINYNQFDNQENMQPQKQTQEEINQQKLEQLKEEIENITDSDIDDPKYTPYNKNVEQNLNNDIQNINNIQNNNDLINLQSKIMYLENNNNIINKSLSDLEAENKFLKSEITKKNSIIKSKEDLNKEYQNLLTVFKDKLAQSENYHKNITTKDTETKPSEKFPHVISARGIFKSFFSWWHIFFPFAFYFYFS